MRRSIPSIAAALGARILLAAIVGGAIAASASGSAVRAGGTIRVNGPTHNLYHVSFQQVITGTAHGAANYVQSGEQLGSTPPCASTYAAERKRSTYTPWPTGTGSVHGQFHLVALFYSRNHLTHAICSYLINRSSRRTYAHAANYWSNA